MEVAFLAALIPLTFAYPYSLVHPPEKVKVSIYYNSSDPASKYFITKKLYDVQRVEQIADIEFIPYAGHETKLPNGQAWKCNDDNFAGCKGDYSEACAAKLAPDFNALLGFTVCLEHFGPTEIDSEYCAKYNHINVEALKDCLTTDKVVKYLDEMAQKTRALNPPLTYSPWIVVNGKHTDEIQSQAFSDPIRLICSMYKGIIKPLQCTRLQAAAKTKNSQYGKH